MQRTLQCEGPVIALFLLYHMGKCRAEQRAMTKALTYRDHFENHRGRDGGYDCGEGACLHLLASDLLHA